MLALIGINLYLKTMFFSLIVFTVLSIWILNAKARPKKGIIFKQIMNEEYTLTKLADIKRKVATEAAECSTIGIIVDCTNPHRKDTKKDFCLKLKIIDASTQN